MPVRHLQAQLTKPNFIFIIVDDLNDYVTGFDGHPQISTPHIKGLADSGVLFLNTYANAPGCAPSRTSFLSGKGLAYTQVMNNEDYTSKFRENFTAAENNEVVYSLPEVLKDNGGYFTYGINKIFHNPNSNDFDKTVGTPMCEKTQSWNQMVFFEDSDSLLDALTVYGFGNYFDWGMIPDSLEPILEDYIATDLAIGFLDSVAAGTANTCGDPFFLTLGYYKPHIQRYIPEKYFPEHYVQDIYAEPFDVPYNVPADAFPPNGIILPPQPDTIYNDYDHLPDPGIARAMADLGGVYDQIEDFVETLDPLPEIDALLTDADRKNIMRYTTAANYQMCYIAAIRYIDAQVGRLLESLNSHAELKENTIVVLISDNGYSLGEKRHWTKWTLWEPDIRVPMIIADPSREAGATVQKTISLVDVFPTICDLADAAYPTFDDGSVYLDGHSFVSLLDEPDTQFEYPALSSYQKNGGIGSCYAHHSIRNERWHYIRYQQNNDGTGATGFCDSLNRSFEQELYEIGINRQTDPYEWNDLSANADYYPVINFLEQWMPDSVMYTKQTYALRVGFDSLDCYADVTSTVALHATLFDTAGNIISLPDTLTIRWSTNRSDMVYYGAEASLDLSAFEPGIFADDPQLIVYAELFGADSAIIKGFDLQYVLVDAINEPVAAFDVFNIDGLTVAITDYTMSGVYHKAWWDFGDGAISYDEVPPPHTFPAPGTYEISRHVVYGNDSCEAVFSESIVLDADSADPAVEIYCFPNPASEWLQVYLSEQATFAAVSLYDMAGRRVEDVRILNGNNPLFFTLDISKVSPGMYIVKVETTRGNYAAPVVVMH